MLSVLCGQILGRRSQFVLDVRRGHVLRRRTKFVLGVRSGHVLWKRTKCVLGVRCGVLLRGGLLLVPGLPRGNILCGGGRLLHGVPRGEVLDGRPGQRVQHVRRHRLGAEPLGPEPERPNERIRLRVRIGPHRCQLRAFRVCGHDGGGIARVPLVGSAVAAACASDASLFEERGLLGYLGGVPRVRRELG